MAKYRGREVKLNKPFRTPGESKKFAVYVRDKKTDNVKKVRFGDPNMKIKKPNKLVKTDKQEESAYIVFWSIIVAGILLAVTIIAEYL